MTYYINRLDLSGWRQALTSEVIDLIKDHSKINQFECGDWTVYVLAHDKTGDVLLLKSPSWFFPCITGNVKAVSA
jgi:hypothetical protein